MRHDFRNPFGLCGAGARGLVLAGLLLFGVPSALAQPAPPPAEGVQPNPDSARSVGVPAMSERSADSLTSPRLVGSKKVRLTGKSQNVMRSGPGSAFSIVGIYPKDRTFTVIARSGEWYNVRLSDTETGWIHASLCEEMDDLSGLQFRPNPKLYTRTGTYVLSGYGGGYAFDRKSNSLVLGGRMGYYVFDRLQAEAGVSWTHVHRPQEIVESLFNLSLEAEDFHMLFYHLNVIWELLPGRQMVPYASGGVGSSIMLGKSEPSFNFGAGTTLFLSKRTAMRWEVRDYRFNSGSEGARISNNNIEFTIGTEYLF